jgi:hypothetical protein
MKTIYKILGVVTAVAGVATLAAPAHAITPLFSNTNPNVYGPSGTDTEIFFAHSVTGHVKYNNGPQGGTITLTKLVGSFNDSLTVFCTNGSVHNDVNFQNTLAAGSFTLNCSGTGVAENTTAATITSN